MKPKTLTKDVFVDEIHDFENHREWVYKGTQPAVIHFWAEWCAPCHRVRKIVNKLSKEYDGMLNFYRVNVDDEQELALEFGIVNIPSVFFIPPKGEPMMQPGELTEEVLKDVIENKLINSYRSAV